MPDGSKNLIKNGDFQDGRIGTMPNGLRSKSARKALAPKFIPENKDDQKMLVATGDGNKECTGYLYRAVPVSLGNTYLFSVRFKISKDVNPHENLLFPCVRPAVKDGIFTFRKLNDGWVQGEVKIHYPGQGKEKAEVQIFFRFSAKSKTWIGDVSLVETDPVQPPWVKIACTQGKPDLAGCEAILDLAGKAKVDLILLSEYIRGDFKPEKVPGLSSKLMSSKANSMACMWQAASSAKSPNPIESTTPHFYLVVKGN